MFGAILSLEIAVVVAIFAAIVGLGSAIIAWRNSTISKKSLEINSKNASLSSPDFATYLVDSFRYVVKDYDFKLYVFVVSVENRSTIPNSIVSVDLKIPLIKDGFERVLIFNHIEIESDENLSTFKKPAKLPVSLAARGSVIVGFYFKVQNEVLENASCESYTVRTKYINGIYSDTKSIVIMDIIDEGSLEKKRKMGIPV